MWVIVVEEESKIKLVGEGEIFVWHVLYFIGCVYACGSLCVCVYVCVCARTPACTHQDMRGLRCLCFVFVMFRVPFSLSRSVSLSLSLSLCVCVCVCVRVTNVHSPLTDNPYSLHTQYYTYCYSFINIQLRLASYTFEQLHHILQETTQ